jgi:hypothetical protein
MAQSCAAKNGPPLRRAVEKARVGDSVSEAADQIDCLLVAEILAESEGVGL